MEIRRRFGRSKVQEVQPNRESSCDGEELELEVETGTIGCGRRGMLVLKSKASRGMSVERVSPRRSRSMLV
jgi:hypothetical protein